MRIAILFSACLIAAACTSAPPITSATTAPPLTGVTAPASTPAVVASPLQTLADFTITDLQAASADAKAQTPPDVTASQCYDFLIAVIPSLQPSAQSFTPGAVFAFQKARDLANGASGANGRLKNLNLACAPLVIDTQTVINKLLLLGAGIAGTGGALAPFSGGLGAIGAALPIPLP